MGQKEVEMKIEVSPIEERQFEFDSSEVKIREMFDVPENEREINFFLDGAKWA